MTQKVDMVGNALYVDDIVANGVSLSGASGSLKVGSTVTSLGGDITIAAGDTIAQALKKIADVADPS